MQFHRTNCYLLAGLVSGFVLLATPDSALGSVYSIVRSFTGGSDSSTAFGASVAFGSKLYGFASGNLASANLDFTGRQSHHAFTGGSADGQIPAGPLQADAFGVYGATIIGGFSDSGTVYGMNLDGTNYHLLSSVSTLGGFNPQAGLALRGSTLYGTTFSGGIGNYGTIFAIDTDGTNGHQVFSLPSAFGSQPTGRLFLSGTNLYGSTSQGEVDGSNGTLFHVDATDNALIVRNFTGAEGTEVNILAIVDTTILGTTTAGTFTMQTDGSGFQFVAAPPSPGLVPFDGRLYGLTSGGGDFGFGRLFSIAPNGSDLQTEHSFGAPGDGKTPNGLILNGNSLLGKTTTGGDFNAGVVFTVAVPEPSALVLAALAAVGLIVFGRRRRAVA